jgi:hypothetical protein
MHALCQCNWDSPVSWRGGAWRRSAGTRFVRNVRFAEELCWFCRHEGLCYKTVGRGAMWRSCSRLKSREAICLGITEVGESEKHSVV